MSQNFWVKLVGFLLLGYLTLGRSFAYLGIPPAKIFIGEVALLAFLVFCMRDTFSRWMGALFTPSPLSGVSIAVLLFVATGFFELFRGISFGYTAGTAIQNLVFNIYSIYVFAGIAVGLYKPDLLSRLMPYAGWLHGIYGLSYIILLDKLWLPIPGTNVSVFGQPNGAPVVILGLLCFPPKGMQRFVLLGMNALVLIGLQVRAEWVGVTIGILLWGILSKQVGRLVVSGAAITVLLMIGFVTDLQLPGAKNRGGNTSVRAAVGRMLAPVDKDLAQDYSEGAGGHAGTVEWRTHWWNAIWQTVHDEPDSMVFGMGYGYPLAHLVPYIREEDVRTPHSVFYYALAYGGWLLVSVFGWMLLQILLLSVRSYRLTGQPFGVLICITSLSIALFGNLFETPFGAIPFYLLVGIAGSAALRQEPVPEAVPYEPAMVEPWSPEPVANRRHRPVRVSE